VLKMEWNEIHRLSKITLCGDTNFHELEGNHIQIIPKGKYYISGFWANACGLSKTLEGARLQINDYLIYSKQLTAFNEVN